MIWIGIDPGAKGALALIGSTGEPKLIPFDQRLYIERLKALKETGEKCVCCIEAVQPIRGNGIIALFRLGQSYGWLLGILDAIGIPYQPITPQKWKKEFGLTSDKAKSIEVCRRLYPDVNLKRTERSKKDDDNCAEAVLMATYAKRKF